MEEFISASVDRFTKFLAEAEARIKKKYSNNVLVSFVETMIDFPIDNQIDSLLKLHERSFYFEKPNENFIIFGFNEALVISESGDKRFAATDKKVKEWKENFVSNWENFPSKDFPLFLGAMKFNVEHADNDWSDFNDSTWFIPEFMLLKINGLNYFLYNFVYSSDYSKGVTLNKFKAKLEKLFSNKPQIKSKDGVKIRNISGSQPKDKKKWKNMVSEALEKISENEIDKIVLSRKVDLILSDEPNFSEIIPRLRKNYSDSYLFIYHHGKSSFFGATPEKLAKFYNGNLEVDALAGSAPRGNTPEDDLKIEMELLNDKKNYNEHSFVIDHIKDSISNFSSNIVVETNSHVRKLANIQHLWTKISASLDSSYTFHTLLKELYPTPAICGLPKDVSLQLIKKLEGYKRGLYSGIIGWFNFNDEGEFVIGIRSALTINNKLIAFAGCGIVENSDPDAEYQETELKLKTILSLFNENSN
ncbi:MAG: isochorismate synthase [Ignavibacteriaceae bacterium]